MPPARKRNGVVFPRFLTTNFALVNLQLGALLLIFGYQQMIASVSPILLIVMLFLFIATAAVAIIWSVFEYRSSQRNLEERLPLYFIAITLFALLIELIGVVFLIATMHFPMLDRAVRLAKIYVDEHIDNIRADALAMAADTKREVPDMPSSMVGRFVNTHVAWRVLTFGALIERDGRIVAKNEDYFPAPTRQQIIEHIARLEEAEGRMGEAGIVVLVDEERHTVIAMVNISIPEADYLVVGRVINKRAVEDWRQTQMYVGGAIRGVRVAFGAFVVLLLLVTAACFFASRRAQ